MKMVIASANAHKIGEIRAILKSGIDCKIELLSLKEAGFDGEIEENGATFEENALIKARAAAALGYIAMADDSGLAVRALGGAPGIHSARYAGEPTDNQKNNEKLLEALRGLHGGERAAKFVSTIALVFPREGAEFTVRGECPGVILEDCRGTGGFGYDPLFLYEPLGKTFAELSPEEKNRVSHRARSMRAFVKLLDEKLKEYGYTSC